MIVEKTACPAAGIAGRRVRFSLLAQQIHAGSLSRFGIS
jgi:hypothetical protein